MSKPNKASIIILTYNNLDYTRQCLDSVFAKTEYPHYEVIVVDNASEDDTPQYLASLVNQHPHLKVILNETNAGFPKGNNIGAAEATGDILVFLNNDTLVTRGWLNGLIQHLEDPTVGMVGPVTNASGNQTRIAVDYEKLEDMDDFAARYTKDHAGQAFEIEMLPFLCVALRREVFEKIGPLDERFGLGMFEDDDYAMRLKESGYKIICAEDVFVHHFGSVSFSQTSIPQYWDLYKNNLKLFEEKWAVRWLPPLQRADFIQDQLRQMIDASIFFTGTIGDLEAELQRIQVQQEQNQNQIDQLSNQIAQTKHANAKLQSELLKAQEKNQAQIKQLSNQLAETQHANSKLRSELLLAHDLNKQLDQELASTRRALTRFTDANAQANQSINELKQHLSDINAKYVARDLEASHLTIRLNDIYASNGWALIQAVLRIRRFFIPEGSRREKALHKLIRFVRGTQPSQKAQPSIAESAKSVQPQAVTVHTPAHVITDRTTSSPLPSIHLPTNAQTTFFPERFAWPLVTVIIPVYNHADMLEAAARSVLGGTYTNLELIILDDGSTDNIQPVLKRLHANPRVHIYRQPNQKLPRALTHAHQFACGDFITWTSADNLMAPNAIESMVRCLLNNPQAVLVYADVAAIDEHGRLIHNDTYRPQNLDPNRPGIIRLYQESQALGYEADNFINACFLYRRSAALALEGYYADDLRGLEDYDFWLRMQKCGKFVHLGNEEPLYYYRVHERTMSHELLTQEREEHINRVDKLIAYDAKRREYASKRWTVVLDAGLPAETFSEIYGWVSQLPVDIQTVAVKADHEHKSLAMLPPDKPVDDPLYIRVLPEEWEINWQSSRTQSHHKLRLWKGIEISPLARKARDDTGIFSGIPQADNHTVIGCHLPLRDLALDIAATRRMISHNAWAYFVFIDIPGKDDPTLGAALTKDLENAIYLGARPLGHPYQLYACMACLWTPVLLEHADPYIHQQHLALGYAIGKPVIYPKGLPVTAAPYQYIYHTPLEDIQFILNRKQIDRDVMDQYLHTWAPVDRLNQVLKLCDAISQENGASRPDFDAQPSPVTLPQRWTPYQVEVTSPIKLGLVVNTLDRGGLEEVVAALARGLKGKGLDIFLLCTKSGGHVTAQLESEGFSVSIADGQVEQIEQVIKLQQPDLVSTHWVDLEFMQVISTLGIPILESIHNTYIWLEQTGWHNEHLRSRYFSHAVAVSDLVKRYYTKWNPDFNSKWISIIPNGIDLQRWQFIEQSEARQNLGIPPNSFLFLNLASYDGRKNQLGLLEAFNEVAIDHSRVRLMCAGTIADPRYHQALLDYHQKLATRDQIDLQEFRRDSNILLSAADAFVINSFFEGWSLAATEALLSGIPLIHTDCGSARELVSDNAERGVVIPNPAGNPLDLDWDTISSMIYQKQQPNNRALVQAMSQMIADQENWREKRTQIKNSAAELFSIQNTIDQYNLLVNKIAKGQIIIDTQDISSSSGIDKPYTYSTSSYME